MKKKLLKAVRVALTNVCLSVTLGLLILAGAINAESHEAIVLIVLSPFWAPQIITLAAAIVYAMFLGIEWSANWFRSLLEKWGILTEPEEEEKICHDCCCNECE